MPFKDVILVTALFEGISIITKHVCIKSPVMKHH